METKCYIFAPNHRHLMISVEYKIKIPKCSNCITVQAKVKKENFADNVIPIKMMGITKEER